MTIREESRSKELSDQKKSPQKSSEELRLSQWMALAQNGDKEAYRKLLTDLNIMLEKYTIRAVRRFSPSGDASFSKDIVQEILLAIHTKRHTYDSAQRFLPWVFGIARHKLVDWQRKHSIEKRTLDLDFEIEEVVSSDDSLSSVFSPEGLTSSGLHSLLEKLNPKQRQVIELTKIQGLSISETAERTGLSEANVKVLTHRGILMLRKMAINKVDEKGNQHE